MSKLPEFMIDLADQIKSNTKRFRRDEDGVFIVFSLFVLISMLVLGGMAVDFIRQENNRIVLQGVADRSVLSAASLEQTFDGDVLVEDYFEKSGLADAIVGTPFFEDTGSSKRVEVVARDELNTYFLKFIGIDTLGYAGAASAIEAVGKVEISLVIDVSGSMRFAGSTPRVTEASVIANGVENSGGRINDLRIAAKAFATAVLDPAYDGQVSLNIVPYAGQTNPGQDMWEIMGGDAGIDSRDNFDIPFDAILPGETENQMRIEEIAGEYVLVFNLGNDVVSVPTINTTDPTYNGPIELQNSERQALQFSGATITNEDITRIGVERPDPDDASNTIVVVLDVNDPFARGIGDNINAVFGDPDVVIDVGTSPILQVEYSPPHACIGLTGASDWTTSGPPANGQEKVYQFMQWGSADWEMRTGLMGWGWCPHNHTAIKYAIQDAADAVEYLDEIRLFDGTGTNNAMKWGLATLDPDMQPNFEALNARSSDLLPDDFVNRPAPYDDAETRKIIVLMTDGVVTDQYSPVAGQERNAENLLDLTPSDVNSHDAWKGDTATTQRLKTSTLARDTELQGLCTLAKDADIEVYTVLFEFPNDRANYDAMDDCATDDDPAANKQYFFDTSGTGLTAVFQEIAEQVSDLRLVN